MRLSEAIRLGSMLGPQTRGSLHRQHRKYIFFGPVVNEYCAIGAAHAAIGATRGKRTAGPGGHTFSSFRGEPVTVAAGATYYATEREGFDYDPRWREELCPACHGIYEHVHRLIPHLNDEHKWTRERIADWVQTLEPSVPSPERDNKRDETATSINALDPVDCIVTFWPRA